MRLWRIICVFVIVNSLSAQRIDFYREKIEMKINKASFKITGTYYFANKDNKEHSLTIYYPFVIDNVTSFPDSISVVYLDGKEQEFIKRKNGISFTLYITENDTLIYKIHYRQKIISKKAEYILTTTKTWKEPFENAEYVITIPDQLDVEYIYPKPDIIEKGNDSIIYKSEKQNFMPDENLKVLWR